MKCSFFRRVVLCASLWGVGLVALGLGGCASKRGVQPGLHATERSTPPALRPKERAFVKTTKHHYHPAFAAASDYASLSTPDTSGGPELDAWRDLLREQGWSLEPGLSRVAHDALAVLGKSSRLVPALRDGLLAFHGRLEIDVSFSRIRGHGSPRKALEQAAPMLLESLGHGSLGSAALGVALSRKGQAWELLVVRAHPRASLRPFSRTMELGDTMTLRGRLNRGRHSPVMMVVDPQGEGRVVRLDTQGDDLVGALRCDHGPGRYQVEWVAQGSLGPEIVVNVPVYCGVPAPETLVYLEESLAPNAPRRALEQASWELVNQVRVSEGLAPLRWDETLADLARAHSAEMERLDYVGHRSPARGSFELRLDEAGIHVPLALENVASGFGPSEILDRLMASPGHRFNILNPEVTHLGVGVAIRTTLGPHRQDSLFLTQHFARWKERSHVLGHRVQPSRAMQAHLSLP